MLTSRSGRTGTAGSNGRRLRSALLAALPLAAITGLSAGSFAFLRQGDEGGQASCQQNLKQYALALLMYCQDYDERFPPMKFPAQVQHRVLPYIKNSTVFSCPVTGADYLPNPAMSYMDLGKVKAPASTIILRDAKPHKADSDPPSWNVAYLDGHVNLVTTEPLLGKPAPTPPPPTHVQQVGSELTTLLQQRRALDEQRRALDARIRQLEKEQRRMHHRKSSR